MKLESAHNDIKSVLKRVRKYEIRLRKVISGSVAGEIKSLTKGSGLEFDDVRPYQYGDDIRAIDWNVTAKGQGTYIKTFKEEKDQTVWVLFDVSGSTRFLEKESLIKEFASLVYLSALNQGSNVGLIAFSDKVEWLNRPSKSKVNAMGEITKILRLSAENIKTSISNALQKLQALEKRKSLVFIISDFQDLGFHDSIANLARKHEVILININENLHQETGLPLGIMPVKSAESKKINFSFRTLFGKFLGSRKLLESKEDVLKSLSKNSNIDLFTLFLGKDYVDDLAIFFKSRVRR